MTINPAIEVFFCYAHEDEKLRDELEKQLQGLKRQGVISGWHDRNISAGSDWKTTIDVHLNRARIILLLVSSDFINSDYCWNIEMERALERHASGEARVIPVILRHCDWASAPFSGLQALPRDARPINSSHWHSHDEAFLDVVKGIKKVVSELKADPR